MENKSNLKNLKENYSKIQKRYNLPPFEELNKNFRIERLAENETDYLIREIRILIGETFNSFSRVLEAILYNPSNLSMSLLNFIKSFGKKEKESLNEIYKEISKAEIDLMKLITYDEKKEADFIKKYNLIWKEVERKFSDVVVSIEDKIEDKSEKKDSSYFG